MKRTADLKFYFLIDSAEGISELRYQLSHSPIHYASAKLLTTVSPYLAISFPSIMNLNDSGVSKLYRLPKMRLGELGVNSIVVIDIAKLKSDTPKLINSFLRDFFTSRSLVKVFNTKEELKEIKALLRMQIHSVITLQLIELSRGYTDPSLDAQVERYLSCDPLSSTRSNGLEECIWHTQAVLLLYREFVVNSTDRSPLFGNFSGGWGSNSSDVDSDPFSLFSAETRVCRSRTPPLAPIGSKNPRINPYPMNPLIFRVHEADSPPPVESKIREPASHLVTPLEFRARRTKPPESTPSASISFANTPQTTEFVFGKIPRAHNKNTYAKDSEIFTTPQIQKSLNVSQKIGRDALITVEEVDGVFHCLNSSSLFLGKAPPSYVKCCNVVRSSFRMWKLLSKAQKNAKVKLAVQELIKDSRLLIFSRKGLNAGSSLGGIREEHQLMLNPQNFIPGGRMLSDHDVIRAVEIAKAHPNNLKTESHFLNLLRNRLWLAEDAQTRISLSEKLVERLLILGVLSKSLTGHLYLMS